ncbi:hypothetical protein CTI12_AA184760 [Artemisia annua]|uniref:Helitron helicase-like domain-containing protein n=1 Tax=Artemisia annua TaxID=35608 RepID=A0A2U1P7R3_ARTAN|nr:hypothetical protein CTI12_AA184760 [Artemisia annua]
MGTKKHKQQPLLSNQLQIGAQDPRKHKACAVDLPASQSNKKGKAVAHDCNDVAFSNRNVQIPQIFNGAANTTCEQNNNLLNEELLCAATGDGSSDFLSHNGDTYLLPIISDQGCSYTQIDPNSYADTYGSPICYGPPVVQHEKVSPLSGGCIQTQSIYQQTNLQSETDLENKATIATSKNRKRHLMCAQSSNYSTSQQPKRRRANVNAFAYPTEGHNQGVPDLYIDIGDADYACQYCNATFWYGSGLKSEIVQLLIQILDNHNELVQVFRTARDKVNEGNIPEFKLQLYNVSGAQEYQLPSSGVLGAIVFQPDENSQTDYDIIVEYKDRQPKRINKLHSSYMSLQFPLLFVYGQPGYNTDLTLKPLNGIKERTKLTMNIMTEVNIKDLKPTSRNKILEAKVYRSWIGRNPPDITEKSYHAILLDRQFYYIIIADYIGCYIQSGEKEEWGNPNKDQMVIRKIEIQNIHRNSVELTLWDDLAESFPKEKIDALEKPILIAVSSCRVSRFRNNMQLSSTPATYYYINPDIPELEQYRAEYKAMFDINQPLQIIRHPYQDKEQEKMRNRIPFSKLLTENPATHTDLTHQENGITHPVQSVQVRHSIMKAVSNAKHMELWSLQPTGSQLTNKELQSTQITIPEQQHMVTAIEYTPPLPSEASGSHPQESAQMNLPQKQIESANTTPPPKEHASTETSTKPHVPEIRKPTTTKRQLFQDKPEDTKKTKKE